MVNSLGIEQIFGEQAQSLVGVGSILPTGLEAFSKRLLQAAEDLTPLKVFLALKDPIAQLHLGHTVILRKLRAFQDMGHATILIVSNPLTPEEQSFLGKILDFRKVTVSVSPIEGDVEIVSGPQAAAASTAPFCLVMPLLEAIDGAEEMSPAQPDTCIFLSDSPDVMFGKLVSIPDTLIANYELLLTPLTREQLKDQLALLKRSVDDGGVSSQDIKCHFSKWLVTQYHSQEESEAADERYWASHS